MSIKKYGIEVGCDQCVYTSSDDQGGFDVTVPVTDEMGKQSGLATLRCHVSPESHKVELVKLLDTDGESVTYDAQTERRLISMLRFVEDRRICGNKHICPNEVVEIAEKFGQG